MNYTIVEQPLHDESVSTIVRSYYAWVCTFLLLIHLGAWWTLYRKDLSPLSSGSPLQKAAYYKQNTSRFNMIFLGDSRTYCGMHPSEIDPLLGTHSYNLSIFAHWLPTQYPAVADLVDDIPTGTTVVWSIGSGNFAPIGVDRKVRDAYPIGTTNIPRYLGWGYRWSELQPNIVHFAAANWPTRLLSKLSTWGKTPCWTALPVATKTAAVAAMSPRAEQAELEALVQKYQWDPTIASVEILRDAKSGIVTSLALTSVDGAYRRIELDRAFFRRQQHDSALENRDQDASTVSSSYMPDAAYWQTYLGMLTLFQQRGLRVIVNEMTEAPYIYRNSARKRVEREFIRNDVRREVEERGFIWNSVDTSTLEDDDYFDYNHLNSQGIKRYSKLLADSLRQQLQGERP